MVPLRVIDGVPYCESRKLPDGGRDHHTDCCSGCCVSVRNNRIVISSVVGSRDTVACPGPSKSASSSVPQGADDGVTGTAGQTASGGLGSKSNIDKSVHFDPTAEVHSKSEDSLDACSTEAPDDDDNMSEASNASDPVRRSLRNVAASQGRQLSHKPGLPIHCTDCMAPKAKRKRRASRGKQQTAKRFGDSMTCDHVFMKDWLGNKGVDGPPDVFNVFEIVTRCVYSFPVSSKDAFDTFAAINVVQRRAKIKYMYSYDVSSIGRTVKLLGIKWESCQPGVHHSNAIIERCNQELLNNTGVFVVQVCFLARFWPYASPYAAHISKKDPDTGESPWIKRYKKHFEGKGIPLGCGVWFLPAPTKYANSKAAPKRSCGFFLG